MIELSLNKINKYYGATKVFDDITFELHSKSRVGIVGRNGTGKTTVFKIIAGLEPHNDGQLTFRKGSTVGYLDQIPTYDAVVLDVLKMAFTALNELEKKLKSYELKLSDTSRNDYDKLLDTYGKLQHEYEIKGGYEIKERIDKICSGFKFETSFLSQPFELLSGGEKTRVILAKILLEQPSILLLDEPTNHLDLDSVEWLEEYLKTYDGSVLIISHDRYFLDHVVEEIYEIERGTTQHYKGNYSYYVEEKEQRLLQAIEAYKQQQRQIKAMEEAIKRFRDWGTRADNKAMFVKAKQLEKRLDKMDVLERQGNHKKMALTFNESNRSGKEVVRIRALNKGYKNNVLLEETELDIYYQESVALLGKNGSGKTTLLKMLLGEETADSGMIKLSESAKVGYMEQEIEFEEPNKTILQGFKDKFALTELEARHKLARFLFYSDDINKKIDNLSGGEKVRLSLCMMMEEAVNVLILDEPTNHVDIDSREMIELALQKFGGTIIFISHDRYFIEQLATKVVHIEDKKLVTYHGGYEYFRHELNKKTVEEKVVKVKKVKEKPKTQDKKVNIYKLQALEKLEVKIQDQEQTIETLKLEMSNETDYEALMTLQNSLDEATDALDVLMSEWLEMQDE